MLQQHYTILTCSRQVKAASRYFFTFFVHAEDTKLKMALGLAGSPAEIAAWHDAERAPKAFNRASFPCPSKKLVLNTSKIG